MDIPNWIEDYIHQESIGSYPANIFSKNVVYLYLRTLKMHHPD